MTATQGRRRGWVALAALALAALAACTNAPPPLSEDAPSVFTDIYEMAVDAGASSEQLTTIRDAAAAATLSYEDTVESVRRSFDCFESHGIRWVIEGVDASRGFPQLNYGWGPADDDSDAAWAAGDECLREHSYFVELLYQVQPSSESAEASQLAARASAIAACVRLAGLNVAADATIDELTTAISSAVAELPAGDPAGQAGHYINCFAAGT